MSTLSIAVGPQHPGSGHFRLQLTLDGDIIVDAKPDPGYVHRGEEKMNEYRNYFQNVPHLERPVILDSTNILYPYVLAVEKLANINVPERAHYLRVIASEMNRIISHEYWLSILGVFLGHSTMFMWPMADRELFIDLMDMLTGARVTHAYLVPGGVRNDMPDGFKEKALTYIRYFRKRLKEYDRIFFSNPIFTKRTQGVGILKPEDAIELGVVGTVLRGSGVRSDIRIDEPYGVYDQLDFDIPAPKAGDSYSRAMVPYIEMYESCRIIEQAFEKMPSGSVRVKYPAQAGLRTPAGETYARTEAARGEMGYYLVSDGTNKPYRLKLSVPSFRNLTAMNFLLKGARLADMPAIYWSFNYWPVEADR